MPRLLENRSPARKRSFGDGAIGAPALPCRAMVYISKVYTKAGDAGQTMLASGEKVSKASTRVAAYGDVDELNAVIGQCRLELERDPGAAHAEDLRERIDGELARIQQELFNLGAELATAEGAKLVIEDRHVEALELAIDALNEPLEPLRSFILPGGGPTATAAHLARTVCRRAERNAVALAGAETVRPQTIRYLNRLSDYLFVLARAVTHGFGYEEVLWDPKST
jgi:cob(I)alamin adenosyltransferase